MKVKAFTAIPKTTNGANTIGMSTRTGAATAASVIQSATCDHTSERIPSPTICISEQKRTKQTINYIFGYGSLICSQSRKISAPTLKENNAIPVVIDNIKRTWTARVDMQPDQLAALSSSSSPGNMFQGQTVMGIQQAHGHNCTGVLIEVDSVELENFDQRERNYDRIAVDLKHVFSLPHHSDVMRSGVVEDHIVIRKAHQQRRRLMDSAFRGKPDGHDMDDSENDHEDADVDAKVWVYLPRNGGDGANHYYPIMQSYVDIILRGCLSIGQEFAESFLASTHGWWHDHSIHHPKSDPPAYLWVDDRHQPHYIRADEKWSREMKHIIDELIRDVLPEPFEKRRHLDTLN